MNQQIPISATNNNDIESMKKTIRYYEELIRTHQVPQINDIVSQFIFFSRQCLKKLTAEVKLMEHDPNSQIAIQKLSDYITYVQLELEKFQYSDDTYFMPRLDAKQFFGEDFFMKTFNFINLKGGVGKTMISENVAYAAINQIEDLNILYVDYDQQGNATRWFGGDPNKGTVADILVGDASAKEVIQPTKYSNIDIIASSEDLSIANTAIIKNDKCNQINILKDALSPDMLPKKYHFIFIDNHPQIDIATYDSLVMLGDIVIVSFPEADSISGVFKMAEQINLLKSKGYPLNLRGVLLNAFINDEFSYKLINSLKAHGLPIFDTKISYATKNTKIHLNQAQYEMRPILETCPNSKVSRDIRRFMSELLELEAAHRKEQEIMTAKSSKKNRWA